MKKNKVKNLWIISLFLLYACSGSNQKLAFWSNDKNYNWDETFANQAIEQNAFQFVPNSLLLHAKNLDYPFLEWLLPYYDIYKPSGNNIKDAIKLGACLADLSYLVIYEKNFWLFKYKNYADSLKLSLFQGYQIPEFYNYTTSTNFDSLSVWISAQFGAIPLICKILEKNSNIPQYVSFGACLETLFLTAHTASFKEEPTLFLILAEHKKYLEYYYDFLKKKKYMEVLGNDLEWISHQLLVTQTVNVWDSVENQFHLKTFPLKEPVLNLHKNLTELRKKWILQN